MPRKGLRRCPDRCSCISNLTVNGQSKKLVSRAPEITRLSLRTSNIKPLHEPILDLKNVTDHPIHQYPALEIAHELVDFDDNFSV
jgi:hypothetical protein